MSWARNNKTGKEGTAIRIIKSLSALPSPVTSCHDHDVKRSTLEQAIALDGRAVESNLGASVLYFSLYGNRFFFVPPKFINFTYPPAQIRRYGVRRIVRTNAKRHLTRDDYNLNNAAQLATNML